MRGFEVLTGRARAIIDTPRFYGALGADGRVSARHALDSSRELFAAFEVVRYQFVQNATLTVVMGNFWTATRGSLWGNYRGSGERIPEATTVRASLRVTF